jgi:hypothetical protein
MTKQTAQQIWDRAWADGFEVSGNHKLRINPYKQESQPLGWAGWEAGADEAQARLAVHPKRGQRGSLETSRARSGLLPPG